MYGEEEDHSRVGGRHTKVFGHIYPDFWWNMKQKEPQKFRKKSAYKKVLPKVQIRGGGGRFWVGKYPIKAAFLVLERSLVQVTKSVFHKPVLYLIC